MACRGPRTISNDQRIAKAGLNDSAQDIEICEVEFEIGDSEIIVEFSNDCHRLEAVAVLVKKKSLEVDRKTKEKWSEMTGGTNALINRNQATCAAGVYTRCDGKTSPDQRTGERYTNAEL